MAALLRVIADYKIKYIKMVAEQIHPDIIFYHDDWGSKQNVFFRQGYGAKSLNLCRKRSRIPYMPAV